jgi:prepilin-type N-terminal cleavage/methylation domain-containing protein
MVPMVELRSATRSDRLRRQAGYTMLELLAALAIIGIVSGIAFTIFINTLPSMRADYALQLLQAQLRQAREISIDQRRNLTMTFQGTQELVTVRQNLPSGSTTLSDYCLPNLMSYAVVSGVPDLPAPDNTGNAKAVNFSNCITLPCSLYFYSDGSIGDASGNPLNGTIFISQGGQSQTARAVAILGTTGKIKGYRYAGGGWQNASQ